MQTPFKDWTWQQYQAAGKHVLSYGAGAATAAAVFGLISQKDASDIAENLNTVWDGVMQVAKGLAGLGAVLIPVYTALRAAHNASPKEQLNHVVNNLSAPQGTQLANAVADPEGRNKLINAVANMPEVKAVVATPAVASATLSGKVVSAPVSP